MAELSDAPADGQAETETAPSPESCVPTFARAIANFMSIKAMDSLGRITVVRSGAQAVITEKELTKKFFIGAASEEVWAAACGAKKFSYGTVYAKFMAAANALPRVTIKSTEGALTGDEGHDSSVIAEMLRKNTLYDEYSKSWYQWEEVWKPISDGDVMRRVIDSLDRAFDGEYSNGELTGTFKIMQARLGRSPAMNKDHTASYDGWSQNKDLLPMQNGVLNLLTKRLAPHSAEHMLNWKLPHSHNPAAKCPTIDKFITGLAHEDLDAKAVLYAFLNCVLLGRSDLQKYLECVGAPGTGKSTYLKLCTSLVGDRNVATTGMEALNNNTFETANIYGKRLVVITDADKYGGKIDVFKSITGQDPVRMEEKHKQAKMPFIYGGMVIVAANQPIQFKDASTAMVRRRVPMHLDKLVDRNAVDADLDRKLRLELPGLINKLLAMPDDEVTSIMRDREGRRREAENRAMCETNAIAAWANDRLIAAEGHETKVGNRGNDTSCLYPNYIQYQDETGRPGIASQNSFAASLGNILSLLPFKIVKKTGGNQGARIEGIRLREATDEKVPPLFYGDGIQSAQAAGKDTPTQPDLPDFY